MGKIYFHADDYGRSEEVSKNIFKCLTKGNLNSVSIMIDHDQKYHKKLKKLKNVNKRLHLNLTELPSVKNNNPIISNLSFIKLLFIDELKKQKILNEIDIQIKKFKKIYKPKELKIDGHEHIHMIPWILEGDDSKFKGPLRIAGKDIRTYTKIAENAPAIAFIAQAVNQIYQLVNIQGHSERFIPTLPGILAEMNATKIRDID